MNNIIAKKAFCSIDFMETICARVFVAILAHFLSPQLHVTHYSIWNNEKKLLTMDETVITSKT
jgi:hypothetical protein